MSPKTCSVRSLNGMVTLPMNMILRILAIATITALLHAWSSLPGLRDTELLAGSIDSGEAIRVPSSPRKRVRLSGHCSVNPILHSSFYSRWGYKQN